MRLRNALLRSLVLVPVVQALACGEDGPPPPAGQASEIIERVPGSALLSPNADPSASYLTVRSLRTLETVGALDGARGALARRVDGIIANQPSDGRLSVRELLQIEAPGFVETLRPEERALLPALWKLLETTRDEPTAIPASPDIPMGGDDAVDVSILPSGLDVPRVLAVSSLPASLRPAMARLEIARDDDGDDGTVSRADLAAAVASPGPYTPDEIAAFRAVDTLFLERAVSPCSARAKVPAPIDTRTTLGAWSGATLTRSQLLRYEEERTFPFARNVVHTKLRAVREEGLALGGLPSGGRIVLLQEGSEQETVLSNGPLAALPEGTSTLEVWVAGARQGSFRVKSPRLVAFQAERNLAHLVDYRLFLDHGEELARYPREESDARLRSELRPGPPSPSGLGALAPKFASPVPDLAPGHYELATGIGTVGVDVYPERVVTVSLPSAAKLRAVAWGFEEAPSYTGTVWYEGKRFVLFDYDSSGHQAVVGAVTNQDALVDEVYDVHFRGELTSARRVR